MVFAPFNMKLNIELNEQDLHDLLDLVELYKTELKTLINRKKKSMEEAIYDLSCDSCGRDYQLDYIVSNDSDQPQYCPFCGYDVDLSDVEDESYEDDNDFNINEMNFERD